MVVLVVLVALLALLAAPSVTAQEQQAAGKRTFTVGIINDVDSLNPFIGILSETYEAWALMFNYLVGYSQKDFAPTPGPSGDPDPDRRAARPDPGPRRLPLPPSLPGPGRGRGRPGGRGRPLPQRARAHPAQPGRASRRLLPD
jgi:hypothetical protein